MNKFYKGSIMAVLGLAFAFGVTAPITTLAAGPAAVNLGTAANFRILAQTAVTDANPTVSSITGSVGVSPAAGSSITGLSCTEVSGSIYDVDGTYTGGHDSNIACFLAGPGANKTTVDNAVADMGTAYTNASDPATPAGVGASNLNVGAGTLSGLNFVPGTYTWGTNVSITNDITLTGSASDVWIFQVTGTLGIEDNKSILMAGGALASNVFWQVTDAVTLKPGSHFEGNILAQTNIAMQAGASLSGRALAQTAVTLIGNTLTASTPAPAPAPAPVITYSSRSGGNNRNVIARSSPVVVAAATTTATPSVVSAPSFPNTGISPEGNNDARNIMILTGSLLLVLVSLTVVLKRRSI